jgi:transcriptional regulator with XRE-family HTH domain
MLGAELRKARKKAGLTQEQLAFRARVDRSYISQLENDHKSPTVDILFALCDAMGASASKIISRVEKQRQGKSSRSRG